MLTKLTASKKANTCSEELENPVDSWVEHQLGSVRLTHGASLEKVNNACVFTQSSSISEVKRKLDSKFHYGDFYQTRKICSLGLWKWVFLNLAS